MVGEVAQECLISGNFLGDQRGELVWLGLQYKGAVNFIQEG